MTIEYNKRVVGARNTNCNICSSPVGQSERERERIESIVATNHQSLFVVVKFKTILKSVLLDLGFLLVEIP